MELQDVQKASTEYDVVFENLVKVVKEKKNFIQTNRTFEILKSVSGRFKNGQLSAIMGPSGAGKTSLLNALSGMRTDNLSGHIHMQRQNSCYITQESVMQMDFKLEELMYISCDLKLGNAAQKYQVVTDILTNLNLNEQRQTKIRNLSGGERKRLAIALELVARPKIFFLDEPTSGLDEVSAGQCMRLLKRLASSQGITIICTIHQPSNSVLHLFDQLYILTLGQCVYQGSPHTILAYLQSAGIECPQNYSPSDYIMELCDAPKSSFTCQSMERFENGKYCYMPMEPYVHFRHILDDHFKPKQVDANINFVYNVSAFRQFCVLTRMMILRTVKSRLSLALQVFLYGSCTLYLSAFFYEFGSTSNHMFDLLKCLSAIITIMFYNHVLCAILVFPPEIKIAKMEMFNHWYGLKSYFFALNLARMPLTFFFNSIMLSVCFWMTNFSSDWWRFALYFLIGHVVAWLSETTGLIIASVFSHTNACLMGPMIISPIMGLGLYGFDFASQLSLGLRNLMKLSFIRVGIIGWMQSIYGENREKMACTAVYCHFRNPQKFLKFLEFEDESVTTSIGLLISTLLIYKLIMYWCLAKRCSW